MKWFKHDSDANLDAKLQNVLLDYGLEGYGLYWYCIELIVGKLSSDNITFSLEHDARIIARNTGSTPEKVTTMMEYFIKVGLFESSDGVVTCLKLANRLDKSMTSNANMRILIENIKSHDGVMIESCKSRVEENRREEKRIDNTMVPKAGASALSVIELWNEFFKGTHATQKRMPTKSLKQTINHRKDTFSDIKDWETYFTDLKNIPFLMGKVHSQNRRPFKLTLDWAVKPANIAKVAEGYYND